MSETASTVRPAEPSDLDAIARIDEKLTAQTRKDYWFRDNARELFKLWTASLRERRVP